MDDKNNILNQLAIISDHLEKIPLSSKNKIVTLDLNEEEFNKIYNLVISKYRITEKKETKQFNIIIGQVNYFFNKYSV